MGVAIAEVASTDLAPIASRTRRFLYRSFGDGRGVVVALTLVSAACFYYFATFGTWVPDLNFSEGGLADNFFWAQAQSIVHGGLSVNPAQLPNECWFHATTCYGYFGLTPSLLRVPLLPLLDFADSSFTPLYITIALTLAVGSALAIIRLVLGERLTRRRTTCVMVVVGLLLGPASCLVMVTRPAMYEEAIAWGQGFACLGLFAFLKWYRVRRTRWLVVLLAALVLGANARPTIVPVSVIIGSAVIARCLLDRRGRHGLGPRRPLVLGVLVLLLPVATTCAVYWLKFRVLIPSPLLNTYPGVSEAGRTAMLALNGGHFQGLLFVPTVAAVYFRPDSLIFSNAFPYLNFKFPFPDPIAWIGLRPGAAYIERSTSLTDSMSLASILVVAGVAVVVWRLIAKRRELVALGMPPILLSVVAAAGGFVLVLVLDGATNRYLGDFYPFVVLGTASALLLLVGPLARMARPGFAVVLCVGGVGVAWGVVVNWALTYQAFLYDQFAFAVPGHWGHAWP